MPTTLHRPINATSSAGVATTVSTGYTAGAGTLVVVDGSVFAGTYPVIVCAIRSGTLLSILNVTARSGNNLTISGAIEGTTDVNLIVGDTVAHRATAGAIAEVQTLALANEAGLLTKAQALVATAVKTSAYTAAAGDLVPVDTTSGAVTVTLPTAPADGSRVAVKHVIQGSTNAVTVNCAGSAVFNRTGGVTTFSLPLSSQGAILEYKSSGAIWYIVADDIPLAQLDIRYVKGTLATSGRVPYETTGGSLTDAAGLTYNGTDFASGGKVSALGSAGFVGTGGEVNVKSGTDNIFRGVVATAWPDSVATTYFQVGPSSANVIFCANGTSANRIAFQATSVQFGRATPGTVPTGATVEVATGNAAAVALALVAVASQAEALLRMYGPSSTGTQRGFGYLDAGWVVSTDASRTGYVRFNVESFGGVFNGLRIEATATGANAAFFASAGSYGGATGALFLANAATVPASNPTGGGLLYVESGALKYRGSSGTVTTLGPA